MERVYRNIRQDMTTFLGTVMDVNVTFVATCHFTIAHNADVLCTIDLVMHIYAVMYTFCMHTRSATSNVDVMYI